jgi:hypothetical protein
MNKDKDLFLQSQRAKKKVDLILAYGDPAHTTWSFF